MIIRLRQLFTERPSLVWRTDEHDLALNFQWQQLPRVFTWENDVKIEGFRLTSRLWSEEKSKEQHVLLASKRADASR